MVEKRRGSTNCESCLLRARKREALGGQKCLCLFGLFRPGSDGAISAKTTVFYFAPFPYDYQFVELPTHEAVCLELLPSELTRTARRQVGERN